MVDSMSGDGEIRLLRNMGYLDLGLVAARRASVAERRLGSRVEGLWKGRVDRLTGDFSCFWL